MHREDKIGIIIQARFSSTRLPGKLFLPFYNEERMVDVFLKHITEKVENRYPVILATSINKKDDLFEEVVSRYGINIFRGSESDVLQRTIDAAKKYHISTVVRVCADNPVYDIISTLQLLKHHHFSRSDYTAYCLEKEIPSIKTHVGIWGEVVQLSALEQVANLTSLEIYHEHVTNFIYGNKDRFKVRLIKAPAFFYHRNDIRLTVDEEEDFLLMQQIYRELSKKHYFFHPEDLIAIIDNNPGYLKIMRKQIEKNKKE